MDLAYIAHSERCALLLDGDGVCRWVVPKVNADDATVAAARRCVGAQYVAALDRDAPGFMGHEPRVGTNLLFALVTDGRVALVRFGPLQKFEKLDALCATPSATARESAAAVTTPSPARDVASPGGVLPTAAESEPPPTVADFPDLEDVIASFSPDPVADDAALLARADAARELEPLVIVDPAALGPAPPEPRELEPLVIVEPDHGAERGPGYDRAAPTPESSAKLPPASAPAPRSVVEPRPTERGLGQDPAARAGAAAAREPAPPGERTRGDGADAEIALTLDASGELDIVTTAFARSERFVAMLKSAADLEIDTGSFSRASSRDLDVDSFMADTEHEAVRPSGFVMRRARDISGPDAPPAPAPTHDETFATDDETRRFSRAAGGALFEELDPPSSRAAPARRGMLPRR
ncbi:MAG: hypothetical protein KF850_29070 [Labilithrix sp.]|nr:hypothetical protein [Labilithrix sp.]